MKRICTELFFIAMLSMGQSYAQLGDFDLSDYKLPELKRKTLETNFNLSGSNNYQSYPNSGDENSNNFYGDISFDYFSYLNNATQQKSSVMGMDFSSYLSNSKEDKEFNNKIKSITPSFYVNTINRRYYNPGSFYETNIDFRFRHNNRKQSYWPVNGDEYRRDLKSDNLSIHFPLKLGKGRIEQVQDARHAVYLFDELIKQNRITPEKSDEELIAFAELISKLKNKRFFDSRIRRIYELEAIDSFLISNDYVLDGDIRYFTTLSDFWAFGNRPIRESGKRFSISTNPGYTFNRSKQIEGFVNDEDEFNTSFNGVMINGVFGFEREKPLNLYWQNSIHINAVVGTMEGKIIKDPGSYEDKIRVPSMQVGYAQTIGYYPNTRTDMKFTYSAKYVQLFDRTDLDKNRVGFESLGIKAVADLSVNYYISPKFRLNFNYDIIYIWQDSRDEVIINFEDFSGSNFIPNYDMNNFYYEFREKEFINSFTLRMVYSIF